MAKKRCISAILAPGEVLYMIHHDESLGSDASGPYRGQPGLELSSFTEQFRAEKFAAAAAAKEDWCNLDTSDFISWLLDKGIIKHVKTSSVFVSLIGSDDAIYAPPHWEMCPACEEARGRPEIGYYNHGRNAQTCFNRCVQCRHEWGHVEEQWLHTRPYIPDDGRDTAAGCVPYAISKAGQLDYAKVFAACIEHGFTEKDGITSDGGLAAGRSLGLSFESVLSDPDRTIRLTLSRLLNQLEPSSRYIVSVKEHWLAVVDGCVIETAETHGRTQVIDAWKVGGLDV